MVKISIVERAPGTGKTRVISMTAVICLSEKGKFLVVAETRCVVRITAEAIFSTMATAGLQRRRVFMIEHVGTEGMTSNIKEVYVYKDEVEVWGIPKSTTMPILGFECQRSAETKFDMN